MEQTSVNQLMNTLVRRYSISAACPGNAAPPEPPQMLKRQSENSPLIKKMKALQEQF